MSQPQSTIPEKITYIHENGKEEIFIRHEELGKGGFSTVYKVTVQGTNKTYAMKIISKKFLNSKGPTLLKELKNEMKIQKQIFHPNVVQSKVYFSDETNYYIVLEYCPGQSIREYLKKSGRGYLTEAETRKILRDVVRGLSYLHSNNIIHHDLKLENYIIGMKGRVKIADFGLATLLKDDDDKQYLVAGTINYLSPEIVQKEPHSYEVDIWAIGVSAFIMLTGKPPFDARKKEVVYERILSCDYHFPSNIILSKEATDFIKSTLQIKPSKRPTAFDLLNHPFLTKMDSEKVQLYDPLKKLQQQIQITRQYLSSQKSEPLKDEPLNKSKNFPKIEPLKLSQINQQIEQPKSSRSSQKVEPIKLSQINQLSERPKSARLNQRIESDESAKSQHKTERSKSSQSSQKVDTLKIAPINQQVEKPKSSRSSQKVEPLKMIQVSQKDDTPKSARPSQKVKSNNSNQKAEKSKNPQALEPLPLSQINQQTEKPKSSRSSQKVDPIQFNQLNQKDDRPKSSRSSQKVESLQLDQKDERPNSSRSYQKVDSRPKESSQKVEYKKSSSTNDDETSSTTESSDEVGSAKSTQKDADSKSTAKPRQKVDNSKSTKFSQKVEKLKKSQFSQKNELAKSSRSSQYIDLPMLPLSSLSEKQSKSSKSLQKKEHSKSSRSSQKDDKSKQSNSHHKKESLKPPKPPQKDKQSKPSKSSQKDEESKSKSKSKSHQKAEKV